MNRRRGRGAIFYPREAAAADSFSFPTAIQLRPFNSKIQEFNQKNGRGRGRGRERERKCFDGIDLTFDLFRN